ncbi:hypothetical protein NM688_g2535 [Phlebia brevispora]|uniref:Uncharacterized protein n=1 Tax=Phlebia brevispora TaxID=194682 RepID=A0ACC1T894_9APHY|nr:hypothetical protein NM688_g2535 [Phlebia brevispora]
MPETSAQAILYRRARRLRRLTGNQKLRSQGEIEAAQMTVGILYCFISSFDVVFIENHHFNLGQNGLAFIGIIVGVAVCYFCFLPWAILSLKPRFKLGVFIPEDRLPLAMFGAVFLPTSMFWFGWTSGGNIHWISPILASALWAAAAFLLFQAGLNYLADCYPRYVASVLAGNDFFRSMVGAAFPLFSTAFFHNLGVGPACSVLGGVGVAMLPIPFILYRYGGRIRSWSKYAD